MSTITLYQLSVVPGSPFTPAVHSWKTLLPLRLLKIPFTVKLVTLTQLREELPLKFGVPKVTLPTIVVSSGAEETAIMDSFHIAQFLERHYATPTLSLYTPGGNFSPPSTLAGKYSARFVEQWVDKGLAHELRPCILHTAYALFSHGDPSSRAHFLAKVGQEKMDELVRLNGDIGWKREQHGKARKQLGIIESLSKERSEMGEPGAFLLGTQPTHSDFVVFAFYPYSLTNPELVRNTWRHPDLPFVGKWLDALFDSGLVDRAEFMPENFVDAALR